MRLREGDKQAQKHEGEDLGERMRFGGGGCCLSWIEGEALGKWDKESLADRYWIGGEEGGQFGLGVIPDVMDSAHHSLVDLVEWRGSTSP